MPKQQIHYCCARQVSGSIDSMTSSYTRRFRRHDVLSLEALTSGCYENIVASTYKTPPLWGEVGSWPDPPACRETATGNAPLDLSYTHDAEILSTLNERTSSANRSTMFGLAQQLATPATSRDSKNPFPLYIVIRTNMHQYCTSAATVDIISWNAQLDTITFVISSSRL